MFLHRDGMVQLAVPAGIGALSGPKEEACTSLLSPDLKKLSIFLSKF